jgi:alanyl-tRNA synthetase
MEPPNKKLKEAAEQLVKAACEDVRSGMDAKTLNDGILKLKEGENSLESLEKQVKTNKESSDTKLNTIAQDLRNLKQEMEQGNNSMKKSQLLAAAIQNCQYNSFRYYVEGVPKESLDLVRTILFTFQQDDGRYLPVNAALTIQYSRAHNSSNEDLKAKMESQKAFRDTLYNQIHELLGVKPRVDSNGRDAIYYS